MNRPALRSLAWAVFLGCSWTWCIGMFLPVLLVRDLGFWGWVVFAVPNVVGAAAMGWVLGKPGVSERLVSRHAAACSAFSAVTIAFHVFFLLWFVPRLAGFPIAAGGLGVVGIYLLVTLARPGWDLPAAAIAWTVSLAMLGLYFFQQPHIDVPMHGSRPALGAAWLAPVCIFGFLLCPYLDLTFHRARQQTTASGARLAFGLGFGVCFLSMIVFTLLYAKAVAPLAGPRWRDGRPVFRRILAAHIVVQSALTMALHSRSFVAAQPKRISILLFLVLAQAALFLGLAANVIPRYRGLDAGELVYRIFMAFYGLVVPAYVWVCMVPGPDRRSGPTPANVRAMLLGIIVAAPMFWMGFIEDHFAWLVPGVVAIVLSRFVVGTFSTASLARSS